MNVIHVDSAGKQRSGLFTITEDQAIIRSVNGIYRQARIARRGDHVYACVGNGFVMLYANGTTSSPTMRWEEIENQDQYKASRLGRLTTRAGEVEI